MYRRLFLVIAVLVAVFAVGCAAPAASSVGDPTSAPGAGETPALTPAASESPLATPNAGAGSDLAAGITDRAVTWLAGQANLSADALRLVGAERTEWTDSCLGLGGPAESCLQAITPGWRITFEANGQQYEVRTDESGSSFRLAPQAS